MNGDAHVQKSCVAEHAEAAAFSMVLVAPPARDQQGRARALRANACVLDRSEWRRAKGGWQMADGYLPFAICYTVVTFRDAIRIT